MLNKHVLSYSQFLNESLNEPLIPLNEGGAYGHLQHPFDNHSLTFADLSEMIEISVNGAFTPDNFVHEKTDGQNLMFTFKDGELRVARNKGHLKNYGENSLTIDGISDMFQGRGEIQTAFTSAVRDLEIAIKALSDKQRNRIFANGKKFMSVEVIYPETQNVVPYGLSMLVFHGTNEYDENGEMIYQDKEEARMLAGMIKQVNQDLQDTFFIRGPQNINLEALPDTSKKEKYYKDKLNSIINEYGLSPQNTISDYLNVYWTRFVESKFGHSNTHELTKLVNRWAHSDKSYNMREIVKDFPEHIDKIREFEKFELKNEYKRAIEPLEYLFLELGADVLTNMDSFLATSPTKASEEMRNEIQKIIDDIRSGDNIENIEKLETELKRIEASGGFKRLVPSEGITFVFKDKLYKYTGLFAPINQIAGILKFKN